MKTARSTGTRAWTWGCLVFSLCWFLNSTSSASAQDSSRSAPKEEAEGKTNNPDLAPTHQPVPDGRGNSQPHSVDPRAMDGSGAISDEPGAVFPSASDGVASENHLVKSEVIHVKGHRPGGYLSWEVSTATKTDSLVIDIPQSIQVVPQQVLLDQQVLKIGEMLENVSGVQRSGSNRTGVVDSFSARGFILSPTRNYYKNGRPFMLSVPPPVGAIERIEFLKGPSSVLYGQAEPGGIVNIVLKRPTRRRFYRQTVQLGSFAHHRASVDTGGPIGGKLGYRANLSVVGSESFRQFERLRQFMGAVAIDWNVHKKVSIAFDGNLQYRRQAADSGLAAAPPRAGQTHGDRVVDVPISRSLNEPWAKVGVQALGLGYVMQIEPTKGFKIRQSAGIQRQENDEDRADPLSILAEVSTLNIRRGDVAKALRRRHTEQLSTFTEMNLVGDFDTWKLHHQVMLGGSYIHSINGVTEYSPIVTQPEDFNVFAPVYHLQAPENLGSHLLRLSRSTLSQGGVFLQDQLRVGSYLHVLAGMRYDWFKDTMDQSRLDTASFTLIHQKFHSPTFRLGVLSNPWDIVGLFASYSQAFKPNLDPFANEQLEPERSQQWEAGSKISLLHGFAFATVTGFHLIKHNVAVVNRSSQLLSIAGKRQGSGAEFDISGELLPGWNVIANYSFLYARILRGDPRPLGSPGVGAKDISGNVPPSSPSHSGKLWMTYRFGLSPKWLYGFRLGVGLLGRTVVQGDMFNTLRHPGYFRLDAMIGWTAKLFRCELDVQANVKNMLNAKYYNGISRNLIRPGSPTTVLGQISIRI